MAVSGCTQSFFDAPPCFSGAGDAVPSTSHVTAEDLYARVKGEVDQLDAKGAAHHEWVRMSCTVLEAVMKCQKLVMEKQHEALDAIRAQRAQGEVSKLRAEAADTLRVLDKLNDLYQRIKHKPP